MPSRKVARSLQRLLRRGLDDAEIAKKLGIAASDVLRERKRLKVVSAGAKRSIDRGRRRLLWALGGLTGLAVVGGWYSRGRGKPQSSAPAIDPSVITRRATEVAAFQDALFHPERRLDYLRGFAVEVPPYAKLEYADQSVLDELLQRYGYIAPPDATANSIPLDSSRLGMGSETRSCLLPGAFPSELFGRQDLWGDHDLILRNVIREHELLHAGHFYRGIDRYPLSDFRGADGLVDQEVFICVSELLGYAAEYRGLREVQSLATSTLLEFYTSNLDMLMGPYYQMLQAPGAAGGLDPTFVQKLRQELLPSRLLA